MPVFGAAQNAGNVLQIPLQGDATSLATGRYAWSIEVKALHTTPITTTYNGYVNIINSDSSEFGDGWSLRGLHRLHLVTGGVILELERGHSLWFEDDGMGGYLTPAGEFSTLLENMDGSFTLSTVGAGNVLRSPGIRAMSSRSSCFPESR